MEVEDEDEGEPEREFVAADEFDESDIDDIEDMHEGRGSAIFRTLFTHLRSCFQKEEMFREAIVSKMSLILCKLEVGYVRRNWCSNRIVYVMFRMKTIRRATAAAAAVKTRTARSRSEARGLRRHRRRARRRRGGRSRRWRGKSRRRMDRHSGRGSHRESESLWVSSLQFSLFCTIRQPPNIIISLYAFFGSFKVA